MAGLASRQRGRPSNRKLGAELQAHAVALVRERYSDFGPKLAHEKLVELHGVRFGRETLRKWLTEAGVWLTRVQRARKAHQPRNRRQCYGELVQIDGSPHDWFEGRGPYCTLLVYVDDATGRLMELRLVASESAFDYFDATVSYLERHGKPVAFYSDKHSIFRVHREGTGGRSGGVSQFGRALQQLNIDIICANTPQAKGRVERMNKTLQDRLVKELRLRAISTMSDANAFLPAFIEDYNRRFAREPANPHDAHRPLQSDQDLSQIFTWQEERTMTRNLVVHFKRTTYLVLPDPETLALAQRTVRVRIHEAADGSVEIWHGRRSLPFSVLDQHPHVSPGEVVDNKRLGAVLSSIQVGQAQRDEKRLGSKKLTLRQKARIRAARTEAPPKNTPSVGPATRDCSPRDSFVPAALATCDPANRVGVMAAFMKGFTADQKARDKKYNDVANQRKRDRELEKAKTRRLSA